jgi:chromosome segregation ATPase
MTHENHVALLDAPQEGAVRVVSGTDLYGTVHHLSEGGWTLVAILQEKGTETVNLTRDDPNGYTKTIQEAVEVTETKYVFRENVDSTLASLQAERDEAKSRTRTLEDKLEKLKEELAEAGKDIKAENERLVAKLRETEEERDIAEGALKDASEQLATALKERDVATAQLEAVGERVDDFGHRENHVDIVQTAIATMTGNGNGHADEDIPI